MKVSWCTLNDGTTVTLYEWIRKLTQALYASLNITELTLKFLGKVIVLAFPGGDVGLPIFDGESIVDFRLPERKFWAIRIGFNLGDLHPGLNIPLPKIPLDEIWKQIIRPIDVNITGSEDILYFKDPLDDEWKLGSECTPEQQFKLIEHSATIAWTISKIYIFAKILIKFGLIKTAASFIAWFYKQSRTYKLRKDVIETLENSEDIQSSLDIIDRQLSTISDDTSIIKNQIGLRLTLR
jgi:hypothetical protein